MPMHPDSARAIEFLQESNAIEGITEIDYGRPELRVEGRGHWGAFQRMRSLASGRRRLELEELCTWQRLTCSEQVEFGHALPDAYIGRLRGPDNPVDVRVGSHVAPSFGEVRDLLYPWLDAANESAIAAVSDDSEFVQRTADSFQRFEAIHPFADGNGRVGRLIVGWLALTHDKPPLIFRRAEREEYYRAHRSKRAMRCFIAEKIREAIYRGGELLPRTEHDLSSDGYGAAGRLELIVEWHELLDAVARWKDEDAVRGR